MSEQLAIDWAYLSTLEDGIVRSESTGIRGRWDFGVYLRDVVPKGKHGAIKAIAAELNVSEQELRFRRRFAEKFPVESEFANALASFGSWHAIVNDALSGNGKGTLDVHFSSDTDEWATPQELFDLLHAEFGFELDVCATDGNAKCDRYFTDADDGLRQEWTGVCWMNPPYGSEIGAWVTKAYESSQSGATVVCLVPARVDTAWWWDNCRYGEIRFLRGRLKFGGGDTGAPFPSAVVVFGRPANTMSAWWEAWPTA